jgi:hypothetical protein
MGRGRITDERLALGLLGVAMAVAAALILWLTRGTTFWIDELTWVMQSPKLDLNGAFQPHDGHLMLTSRLVYKAILETFGPGYLPFRLLSVAMVLTTVALFFVYAGRRAGKLVALAPSIVLLFFGSDALHVLLGNGFTVLLAVSCGIGALLALDRDDRVGDAAACGLLCLGIATYSVALAFVAAVGVGLMLRDDRWRRIWIAAVPIALYGAWLLWASKNAEGPSSQVTLSNILLIPSWGFQSLSSVLSALIGVDYHFSGSPATVVSQAGPTFAVLALVGFGLRVARGSVPRTLWVAATVPGVLWALGALASDPYRSPEMTRYLYPGAVAVLLVASEAVAGIRWSRAGLIALYIVAVAGLMTNLALLRYNAAQLRDFYAVQVRAAYGALDVAGERAKANFSPPSPGPQAVVSGGQSPLTFPFKQLADRGESPTAAYRAVAARYGPLGFSLDEIRANAEDVRAQVDSVLVAALGLKLTPAAPRVPHGRCHPIREQPGQTSFSRLPRGGALLTVGGVGGSVEVRRFADSTAVPLGSLAPGQAAILRVPADRAPGPWWVSASGSSALLCELR